jgi:hypothetical protein
MVIKMADNDQVNTQTITVDGKQYPVSDLSNTAKTQIAHIRYVEKQIEEVKNQQTILQAARQFYAGQLSKELSSEG